MKIMRNSFYFKALYFPLLFVLCFCLVLPGLAQDAAEKTAQATVAQASDPAILKPPDEKKDKPGQKPPAASFGVTAPKDAAAYFQEAKKLSSSDIASSILLYQRGLIFKSDDYAARKELADLFEKQGQWNSALAEYELVHKKNLSIGSYTDLVRILDKAGYLFAAASEAEKAYKKYPAQAQFLFQAGELFHKAGDQTAAVAAFQEYLKRKPDDGQAWLKLGAAFEKAQKKADALNAYLCAEKILKDDKALADVLERLKRSAVILADLTLFAPKGWTAEKEALSNFEGAQQVTVTVKTAGEPKALALAAAKEVMPQEFFSAATLKQNEQMKKMRQELAKKDKEAAKDLTLMPTPLLKQGDSPVRKGAKKVLIATSETNQPGMRAAVSIAVPVGKKVYIFLWQADMPVEDGEKLLTLLLNQIVWPL